NTQPPEGGCARQLHGRRSDIVSTLSRPKAAAAFCGTPADSGFEACYSPTSPQKCSGGEYSTAFMRTRPIIS
ncbi:hypothetical protein HMPREF9120_02832, partial [Neisseria sp. oral taxon 020 str. F0370]